MEKRWDWPKLVVFQTIAAGVIVAGSAFLLPALGLALSVLARSLGVLIGDAVDGIVRSIFSAIGAFIPRHGLPEFRHLPFGWCKFTFWVV